ncbi:MAG: glutamate--tRNA ligase [Planctomycetota bacterium]|jgi:glutamyl-tRNA synthetase
MTVRVRIAPSPTGDPHVGTAYIGLLNYCFAKSQGGEFVLRIEDTDQTRCTESSKQAIFDSLKWLGLNYDEGPDIGGDRGPYVQSERVATGIYRQYADQLIEQGDAYYCFATADELDAMRRRQRLANEPIMYDRRYRGLDIEEARARIASGEPYVVRMKSPLEGEFVYKDRLRKQPFVKQWKEIDDQVLLKADGWPTYHLAAVVDDHLMAISHVIRAEEWLNSLPKHVWLNERLGFTAPEYIHVGLLRNADKSKISKRKNPTNIMWYKEQGYLPQVLLNFLALLGHSHPEGKEQFDLAEMVGFFDIDRLNVTGPVFDMQKLRHIQGLYFRDFFDAAATTEIHRALDERLPQLLPLLRERMVFGGDVTWLADIFFAHQVNPHKDDLIPKGWDVAQAKTAVDKLLSAFKKALKKGDFAWEVDQIEELVRAFAAEHEYKPKHLFMLIRVAITGRKEAPPLFDTLYHVGQQQVLDRLGLATMKLR